MKFLAFPLATCLLALTSSSQTVLVVDDEPGPGVDFNVVQDAIAAAASGTIVLVRAGNYGTELLSVVGGSLTLVFEPAASFGSPTTLTIRNVGPGDEVVVHGLVLDASGLNSNEILQLEDNQGVVWLEASSFIGADASFFTSPDTVLITNCDQVVVRDCTIVGGTPPVVFESGRGIRATSSSLFLHDSVVEGGEGTVGGIEDGGPGGAGIALDGAFLFASGATIRGGTGGSTGSIFGCGNASGDGGDGLVLAASSPTAFLRNTTLEGGVPGEVMAGCSSLPGAPGAPSSVVSGTLQESSTPPHSVSVTSPVRTDELADIAVSGVPGELALMLHSPNAAPVHLPALFDALVLANPIQQIFIGQLDGTGSAALQVQPVLPPGVLGRRLFTQVLFFDAMSATATFGSPNTVVVLDAAL